MTTYTIALDDVDLALLPVRSHRYNDFLKKEYYEFKVMAGETETEDDPPIIQHYRCHLCAIDVPTIFSSEHCAGAKHQANVRIATVASQRMRNLAAAKTLAAAPQTAETFCDPCATVVDKDHDKTKEHRVAVMHDRILCELSKLYAGEDDSDETVENEQVSNDTAAAKHVPPKPKALVNASSQTDVIEDSGKMTVSGGAPEDNEFTKYVKIPLKPYIKILKSVPLSKKVSVKAVGFKMQITVDKHKMLVATDSFHSFYREGAQLTCYLCMRLLKPGEEEIHKLSMVHIESIMKVVDGHCIRQVNANWSHCILCNLIVKNINVQSHKLMEKHLENRGHAIIPKKQEFKLTDLEKAGVDLHRDSNFEFQENKFQSKYVLSKAISNSAENVLRKIDIPKIDQVILAPYKNISQSMHVQNSSDNENTEIEGGEVTIKNDSTNAVDEPKTVMNPNQIRSEIMSVFLDKNRIDYPFQPIDQGTVNCTICSCIVPRSLENRVGHLNGQRHAKSVKKQFPGLVTFNRDTGV